MQIELSTAGLQREVQLANYSCMTPTTDNEAACILVRWSFLTISLHCKMVMYQYFMADVTIIL
jgi:hypothetical protein